MTDLTYILATKYTPNSYTAKRFYGHKEISNFKIKRVASEYAMNYSISNETIEGHFEFKYPKSDKNRTYVEIYMQVVPQHIISYVELEYIFKHIKRLVNSTKIKDFVLEEINEKINNIKYLEHEIASALYDIEKNKKQVGLLNELLND